MRIRWWQSIRWRLAIGSMAVAFIATTLLTLLVILAIPYYYGADQRTELTSIATRSAGRIGESYAQSGSLAKVFQNAQPSIFTGASVNDYFPFVFDRSNRLVYPNFKVKSPLQKAIITRLLSVIIGPAVSQGSNSRIGQAVNNGQRGIPTVSEIGQSPPGSAPSLFAVEPIFAGGQPGGQVVGVVIVVPRSVAENVTPPFLDAIRQSILIASVVVAILAALVAILFSRTITRPLAKLTNAARVLAAGNYSGRVTTSACGELGELAHTFNEMAARLENDVNELHRQELGRRELIMNITHDLATPLTALAGLGESLMDGVNSSREDYEATGRIIVRETLRLRRLVKDLHIMAKVEAGALQPQRKRVRLAALVDEVLAVLAPEFERANVEPCNSIAYDLPVVLADPDMLMRVFSNLCDNALGHTPAGGTVVIDATRRGNVLGVSVIDNGEGIPAEALPRVFDRFYRVDVSRQAATGGSGLGLAIVRAIVEAHGGSVRAENVEGGGARIVFTLPVTGSDKMVLSDALTQPLW
jgi:signal transduction histidine kinase